MTLQRGDDSARLIEACPVGCGAALRPTALRLPEGLLLECSACSQLVSQVTAARYREAMQAFDEPQFNQPSGRELERRSSVAKRRLERIAALLEKPSTGLRLIDVG